MFTVEVKFSNCPSDSSLEELGKYSVWSGENGSLSESNSSNKEECGTLGPGSLSSKTMICGYEHAHIHQFLVYTETNSM